MTVHRKHPGSRLLAPELLAGWIFADILIVLFIVGLGSAVEPKPEPTPTPSATASPSSTPSARPRPRRIVGMKTTPAKLDVKYDTSALLGGGGAAASERASVCRQIRRLVQRYANDRAALVLIFGGGSDIAAAQSSAVAIGQQLTCGNSKVFRPNTPYRDFWHGRLSSGNARLEVFFFTTS